MFSFPLTDYISAPESIPFNYKHFQHLTKVSFNCGCCARPTKNFTSHCKECSKWGFYLHACIADAIGKFTNRAAPPHKARKHFNKRLRANEGLDVAFIKKKKKWKKPRLWAVSALIAEEGKWHKEKHIIIQKDPTVNGDYGLLESHGISGTLPRQYNLSLFDGGKKKNNSDVTWRIPCSRNRLFVEQKKKNDKQINRPVKGLLLISEGKSSERGN